LFLVIAGFLSVQVLSSSRRSAGSYLVNRVIRIVPMYWIFTLLAFVVQNYGMSNNSHNFLELVMSLVFIPYGPYPVLYPTWTLTLIVEFSIIAAICRAISIHATAVLSAAVTVGLVILGMMFEATQPALKMYTHPMLLDFALGALLYELRIGSRLEGRLRTQFIVGIVLVSICAVLLLFRQFAWPETPRFLAAGLPAGGLLLGVMLLERAGFCLSAESVQRFAKCSFAIYLCHWFWNICVEKAVTIADNSMISVLLLILTPLVVSAAAILVFRYLEKPISETLAGLHYRLPHYDRRSGN